MTCDQRTIVPLLKGWDEAGTAYGGVIFVDEKAVAPNDFGGLMRVFWAVFEIHRQEAWAGGQKLYRFLKGHSPTRS